MRTLMNFKFLQLLGLLAVGWSSHAQGAIVNVTVTFQNLAPTNSVSFAPLRVGFNNGTFDSFNIGTTATAPIVSIAEGGSGSAWFPAFAAADPTAVLGTVGGALVPTGNVGGGFASSASQTFTIDTNVNRFFTFASMVIPSNDLFIGNDNPAAFQILDSSGNLLISQINQTASQIWDANSEVAIAANAAFVAGGVNGNRVEEGGTVAFDFAELNVFNGLTTGAGYVFNNSLAGTTDIGRISFSVTAVPEPSSMALVGLMGIGVVVRRFRKKSARV
ncbi:MAG: PEP-CTERM sorting domain-containing protein [Pirellulaceae bacterium]|nr:PEP-CTERM sorting domain-containing protein [Pirellulaceae bacterium]